MFYVSPREQDGCFGSVAKPIMINMHAYSCIVTIMYSYSRNVTIMHPYSNVTIMYSYIVVTCSSCIERYCYNYARIYLS